MQDVPPTTGTPRPFASYEDVWCVQMMPDRDKDRLVEVVKVGRRATTLLNLYPRERLPPYVFTLPTSTVLDAHGPLVWVGRRADLEWIRPGADFQLREGQKARPSARFPTMFGRISCVFGTMVSIDFMPARYASRLEGIHTLRRYDLPAFIRLFREGTADERLAWANAWAAFWETREREAAAMDESMSLLDDLGDPGPIQKSEEPEATANEPATPVERVPHWARLKG